MRSSTLVLVGCAGLAPKVDKRLAALWFCPSAQGWALTRVFGGRQIAVFGVLRKFRSSGGAVQP